MQRRQFVQAATLAATASGMASACRAPQSAAPPAAAGPFVQWRMATSWPKSLDIVFGSAERICQRISDMTNGRFTIVPYASGELSGGLDVLSSIHSQEAECGHTAAYYYMERNPALAFATTVPFGLNAQQQTAWFYHGGGLELMRGLYSDFGVINFPAGSTGAQMGGWFKQKVTTVADLSRLKMRIPGLGGKVMEQLGVDVQVLPGEDIFVALNQGTLDAAEWVGPYEDEKLGLNRVATHYYYPGWWEPGTTYEVQVNLGEWQRLPLEYQQVFEAAVREAHLTMLAQYDSVNGAALDRLQQLGTQLHPYSEEILSSAETAALDLYAADASADPSFSRIYRQWQEFRQQIYRWNRLNELSYAQVAQGLALPQ